MDMPEPTTPDVIWALTTTQAEGARSAITPYLRDRLADEPDRWVPTLALVAELRDQAHNGTFTPDGLLDLLRAIDGNRFLELAALAQSCLSAAMMPFTMVVNAACRWGEGDMVGLLGALQVADPTNAEAMAHILDQAQESTYGDMAALAVIAAESLDACALPNRWLRREVDTAATSSTVD